MRTSFFKCSLRAFNLGTKFIHPTGSIQFFTTNSTSQKEEELNLNLDLRNIQWFDLDENGFIKDPNKSIPTQAAVYIYQFLEDPD